MNTFQLDQQLVRRHFGHAAGSYEHHDALQREVQAALLERLEFYLETPERVVDVGAGTGRGTALLKQKYPKAEVIAIDLALPMLQAAKQHNSWLKPFRRVCAEAPRCRWPTTASTYCFPTCASSGSTTSRRCSANACAC